MLRIEKYPENIKFREVSHTTEGLVYMCFYADRSHAHKRTTCVLDNSVVFRQQWDHFSCYRKFSQRRTINTNKNNIKTNGKIYFESSSIINNGAFQVE